MAQLRPPATGTWTVDALIDLPTDLRYEIHDGNLVIMSPAKVWHERVARRICNALEGAGHIADLNVGVYHRADDVRVPNVAVFRTEPDLQDSWHDPGLITLVVEVWSPSSAYKDHREMWWYGDLGIPAYWLAEPIEEDPSGALISRYELAGPDGYVLTDRITLADLMAA
jgi:Uma2 family endonuclease